jgi:hypothetical protein
MDYPALVYRCPGAHFGPDGTTYDSLGVRDDEQLRAALADGWAESLVKAVEIYLGASDEFVANPVPDVDAAEAEEIKEGDEGSPPTREELEEKANELGIKFDGRTTDRKLLEKIEEVLRGE